MTNLNMLYDYRNLQDYDFMEIETDLMDITADSSFSNQMNSTKNDPNLNVTSAPEHLDVGPGSPTFISFFPPAPMLRQTSMGSTSTLTELTLVDQAAFVDQIMRDPEFLTEDTQMVDGLFFVDGRAPADCDFRPQLAISCPRPAATVTLVKPVDVTRIASNDPVDIQLLQELYSEVPVTKSGETLGLKEFDKTTAPLFRLSQPTDATTSVSNLPFMEPLELRPEVQTPAFDELVSPSDSADTLSSFGSEDASSSNPGVALPADREAEIDRMAAYIRAVIEKRNNKPDDMSSKLKVHEVILVILLNAAHGDRSKDLQRILAFCDENGRETAAECRHFKTLDTETMGLLWQRIKGNKKGNYDTFARAMRVRRERSEGFFDYLDAGKGKKKRIYRFGVRSMEEMGRLKKTLRQMPRFQSCSC